MPVVIDDIHTQPTDHTHSGLMQALASTAAQPVIRCVRVQIIKLNSTELHLFFLYKTKCTKVYYFIVPLV